MCCRKHGGKDVSVSEACHDREAVIGLFPDNIDDIINCDTSEQLALGINDERMARRLALPLDVNQNQFQFEMNDYQSIPGNPEPIDDRVKAYLYVYGRLGPVGMVSPGFYTNPINIQVWY